MFDTDLINKVTFHYSDGDDAVLEGESAEMWIKFVDHVLCELSRAGKYEPFQWKIVKKAASAIYI